METLITISIFITEILTMVVLGFFIFLILIPIYDWLKSDKKHKEEKDKFMVKICKLFERSDEDEKPR